jgi:2-oxoglutarate ferredoxin oxidoreductase subunit delta
MSIAVPIVEIEEKGCRGCTICVDKCPVSVFEMTETDPVVAKVVRTEECMGCHSCVYLCPSQCITITGVALQRPFHRIEKNVAFVERFLQITSATASLTEEDWEEADRDVSMTLMSLSKAIVTLMGRGTRAIGRKSGSIAASHLPEIYEEKDLDGVLKRLQERFRHCFDFEYHVDGSDIELAFAPCALQQVVDDAGEKAGDSVVCQLFHDYLAGLIGAYTGVNYVFKVSQAGPACVMRLSPL